MTQNDDLGERQAAQNTDSLYLRGYATALIDAVAMEIDAAQNGTAQYPKDAGGWQRRCLNYELRAHDLADDLADALDEIARLQAEIAQWIELFNNVEAQRAEADRLREQAEAEREALRATLAAVREKLGEIPDHVGWVSSRVARIRDEALALLNGTASCQNSHTWTMNFDADPERGALCDCGKKAWGIDGTAPKEGK